MKKRLLTILLLILIFTLASCSASTKENRSVATGGDSVSDSGNDTNTDKKSGEGIKPNTAEETTASKSFDASTVASNIDVKGEFYSNEFSNNLYLILTNNSGTDCNVSISVDLFDDSGKIVGTEDKSIEAFAAGTSVVASMYSDDKFSRYEYTLTAKELSYYHCVDQDLSCEVTTATNKAIISVTNNGKVNAQFVEYYALFFKGDSLADVDWGYVVDDDSEIKSGATQKQEASCFEEFDTVKVYLHGRSEADYTM